MLLLPMSSMAQEVAYAVLKDSTLTFYYGNNKPQGAYDVEKFIGEDMFDYIISRKEWYSVNKEIKTVVFDKSFKKYKPKSCEKWFEECENLTTIKGIKENLNTSEVTNMSWMFSGCENLTSLDVSGFKTDNVTDMMAMFYGCENLTNLDVSGFKTDNVTNMSYMFSVCENLTSLDVSGFKTDNVTDMRWMFAECENLKTIYVGAGWNTSNVTESEDMFEKCYNLVGGQGTKFNENHTDVEYAHIDGGESNPGYFTKKN